MQQNSTASPLHPGTAGSQGRGRTGRTLGASLATPAPLPHPPPALPGHRADHPATSCGSEPPGVRPYPCRGAHQGAQGGGELGATAGAGLGGGGVRACRSQSRGQAHESVRRGDSPPPLPIHTFTRICASRSVSLGQAHDPACRGVSPPLPLTLPAHCQTLRKPRDWDMLYHAPWLPCCSTRHMHSWPRWRWIARLNSLWLGLYCMYIPPITKTTVVLGEREWKLMADERLARF